MQKRLIALTFLMLVSPAMLMAQVDADAATTPEQAAEQEDLRAELEQARRDVAEAARKLAHLQRKLADTEAIDIRVERLRALDDMEGELARLEEHIHRRVVRGLGMGRARLGVLLGGEADANQIVAVTPGSGADKAGIRSGDRLIAINGQEVDASRPDSLREPMEGVEAGDTVPVEIERDGERISLDVTVSSAARDIRVLTHDIKGPPRPAAPGAPQMDREVWVLERQGDFIPEPPLPPGLPGRVGHSDMISNHAGLERYFGTAAGVVVLRIDSGNELGLEDGDVVLSIDGEAVSRPVDIALALLGRSGETASLEVMRDGERITIEAELTEPQAGFPLTLEIIQGL